MAYSINGKIFSSHPLMDEMIYNLNIIMENIEIKDPKLALNYETEESLTASDTYISILNGSLTFDTFPFSEDLLVSYGYDEVTASDCAIDRWLIPEDDRQAVFEFCEQEFIDTYVEQNNYYRALIGLPWVNSYEPEDTYYVYIDESYITEDYVLEMDLFDYDVPVHEFTNYQIQVLMAIGAMDVLYEEYSTKEYKYLHFLGDSQIDLYKARIASDFDILYMPSVETLVSNRFEELFLINKTVMLHRYYSEAYKIRSEYYDEIIIVLLLCQTYTDMIADIPEWYIRRDVFDLRSCKYFLESHGIEFFREIPLKYQIRIVKNMNKLIRYKSTNKNFWDILDIFDADDVTVYEYYIFKKRIANEQGSYATGKDPADEYELEFVKTPIGETYDDYIKNNLYREQYDVITYQDKWWDGQDTHEYVKQLHLEKDDYTIEGTKFISIEYAISMSDYTYQMSYFVGLLLDSSIDMDDILINIPTISSIISFPLSDLFILLFCMTASYDDLNLNIIVPDNKQYGVKPDFEAYEWFDGGDPENAGTEDYYGGDPNTKNLYRKDINGGRDPEYTEITQESFYNWLAWRYPYLWTDLSNRVNGFNMDADLDELAELIGFRHSSFGFQRGYTLEELGVDGFMTTDSISTIDELVSLYENNTEIYNNLKDLINNAETRDEKVVYQFVFDYLFTKNYDISRYTLSNGEVATTYDQILKERNYVLWKYYDNLTSESDLETRRDAIRADMSDIIDTLQYYLNYDCLKYIFSAFSVSSFQAILRYIYLMINFFRSWKVYFIEAYIRYNLDDKTENRVNMNDNLGEHKDSLWKSDRFYQSDNIGGIEVTHEFEDHVLADRNIEYLDVFGHYEADPLFDNDIKGGKMGDGWNFIDLDGGPADEQTYVLNIDGKYADNYEQNPYVMYGYDIIGGTVETELELDDHTHDPSTDLDDGPIQDIDGGGVDFTSYIPYIMLNGGREGAGKALFDLDGGSPYEAMSYVNVDGKNAIPGTEKHGPTEFDYDLDGGHPDMRTFVSKTMITRIIDNQVVQEVRLADANKSKANLITKNIDGLYLEDKYLSYKDLYNTSEEIKDLNAMYQSYYEEGIDSILLSNSESFVSKRVDTLLDNYFNEALTAYKDLNGDLLARNKKYTDSKNDELLDIFESWIESGSLIAWDQF